MLPRHQLVGDHIIEIGILVIVMDLALLLLFVVDNLDVGVDSVAPGRGQLTGILHVELNSPDDHHLNRVGDAALLGLTVLSQEGHGIALEGRTF